MRWLRSPSPGGTHSVKAGTFVLGQHVSRELGRLLDDKGVLDGVTDGVSNVATTAVGTVKRRIAPAAAPLLDIDLARVAVLAWRTEKALREAAEATVGDETVTEIVPLARHRIDTTRTPRLDVIVNGVTVAHVKFEVSIALHVESLIAVVRQGALVGFETGKCEAAVALAAGGQQLAERRAPLNLEASVALRDPIPLLGDASAVLPEQSRGPRMGADAGSRRRHLAVSRVKVRHRS